MKKFWKHFFKILMTFVEKCWELPYKFLSILMEILYFFYVSFWKNFRRIVGKIYNYRYQYGYRVSIWILIPEKSIDTYRFQKISISIDTFPITTVISFHRFLRTFYDACTTPDDWVRCSGCIARLFWFTIGHYWPIGELGCHMIFGLQCPFQNA